MEIPMRPALEGSIRKSQGLQKKIWSKFFIALLHGTIAMLVLTFLFLFSCFILALQRSTERQYRAGQLGDEPEAPKIPECFVGAEVEMAN